MEEPVVTRFGVPAGFWRRGFADLLDAFVFALPMSAIIGVVMAACDGSATFMRAFGYALSVGTFAYVFAIGYLVYVTIMNSRIGGGATIGKRILGLRVVALDGSLLPLDRSLVRSALLSYGTIVGIMWSSAQRWLPSQVAWPLAAAWHVIGNVLVVACVFAIPFRALKRGFHDVVAGSMVVYGGPPDPAYVQAHRSEALDRRFIVVVVGSALALAATTALLR